MEPLEDFEEIRGIAIQGELLLVADGDSVIAVKNDERGRPEEREAQQFLDRIGEPGDSLGVLRVVVERDEAGERLRVLRPGRAPVTATGREADEPEATDEVVFEKQILRCDHFEVRDGRPVLLAGEGKPAPVKIRLIENLLNGETAPEIMVLVEPAADGCRLKTVDGLPLARLTERRGLRRVLLEPGSSEGEWLLFQGDGAVVEKLKVRGLEQMMAFDCGGYTLEIGR